MGADGPEERQGDIPELPRGAPAEGTRTAGSRQGREAAGGSFSPGEPSPRVSSPPPETLSLSRHHEQEEEGKETWKKKFTLSQQILTLLPAEPRETTAANLIKETRGHRTRGCCVHSTSHLPTSPPVPSSTAIATMRPEVAFSPAGVSYTVGRDRAARQRSTGVSGAALIAIVGRRQG